jgi:hypothetical protein
MIMLHSVYCTAYSSVVINVVEAASVCSTVVLLVVVDVVIT